MSNTVPLALKKLVKPFPTEAEVLDVQAFAKENPNAVHLGLDEKDLEGPSGPTFGRMQDAAMGLQQDLVQLSLGQSKDFMIVDTAGGIQGPEGENIATGLHTGHWELTELSKTISASFKKDMASPYRVSVSDPCDGRSQGTLSMMDSLAYRNAAFTTINHLVNSLPTRKGVVGVASCDKGLPAMTMSMLAQHDLATILVPGGVTLPNHPTPENPHFPHGVNAGTGQDINSKFKAGQMTVDEANEQGCKACGTPGGGCQFLGTAASAQVVAEALGMSLTHSALVPSGQPVWRDMGKRSAEALMAMEKKGITTKDVVTKDSIENAMTMLAAFGGSTNMLLHITAYARAAKVIDPATGKLWWPSKEDYARINKATPRIVNVLPNHDYYTTVHAFMSGGVPEAMLKLRGLGLLHENVMTVEGKTLGENLDAWEKSTRRSTMRELLRTRDGIDPDDIICTPERAKEKGMTSTVTFPDGNIAPEGSVVKSTSIQKDLLDENGVFKAKGRVRIFTSESELVDAITGHNKDKVKPIEDGEILMMLGFGPMGMGMPETAQVARALKDLHKTNPLLTDGRFSGVSTGACIGHIGPEALAGGPVGKLRDGDVVDIHIDTKTLDGRINFIGTDIDKEYSPGLATRSAQILEGREMNPIIKPHPELPEGVRIWAAKQDISGGTWGGCYWDDHSIVEGLTVGKAAMQAQAKAQAQQSIQRAV